MLLAFGPMVTFGVGRQLRADRVQAVGDELADGRAAAGILQDDVDERVPHVRGAADRLGCPATRRAPG